MMMLIALAPAAPLYNTDDLRFSVQQQSTAELRERIRTETRGRKIRVEAVHGEAHIVILPQPAGDLALRDLERPALLALLLGMQADIGPDTEYDLLFSNDAGQMKPVSMWVGPKRKKLVISWGDSLPSPPPGPEMSVLVDRHGLAGFSEHGARFEPRVRGALDIALRQIRPEERAMLSDITLVRQGGSSRTTRQTHRAEWTNTASYVLQENTGRIEVYDEAVLSSSRFVGPVGEPVHPTVFILLHELGHAIADAPFRSQIREHEARRKSFNHQLHQFEADRSAFNAAISAHNAHPDPATAKALDRTRLSLEARQQELNDENARIAALGKQIQDASELTPVGTRYAKRFGALSPTLYGQVSADEAFAEAFALYYTDPAALKRTVPGAWQWFRAGEHLE